MKTAIASIFFYLLIAFAIWTSKSIWPLFALLVSPIVFESLDKTKKDNEDDNTNNQLNS